MKKTIKSSQVPVTAEMLQLVKQELKSDIRALDYKLNSKIDKNHSEVLVHFEKMNSSMFEIKVLVEEQNARNNYVLDGHSQLVDGQTKIKVRLARVEKKVLGSAME